MNIPGLGEVEKDERLGWYYSQPLPFSLQNDKVCRVVIDGYDDDDNKEDFHRVIANLVGASFALLKEAEPYVFQYYRDMNAFWKPSDEEFLIIELPHQVWSYVQFTGHPVVRRRGYGDKKVYVSLDANCDWEREHGLQIVLREGTQLAKVGPYDGHLTNSDAFDDDSLENVIYQPL